MITIYKNGRKLEDKKKGVFMKMAWVKFNFIKNHAITLFNEKRLKI